MKFTLPLRAPRRRSLYVTGVCLSAVGLILICSVLVTVATNLNDWATLGSRGRSIAVRTLVGTLFVGLGFGAVTVASHAAIDVESGEEVGEEIRRSEKDRELLRRVDEHDARLFDDPRHFPRLTRLRRTASTAPSAQASQVAQVAVDAPQVVALPVGTVLVIKVRCRTCRKLSAEEASCCEFCGRGL